MSDEDVARVVVNLTDVWGNVIKTIDNLSMVHNSAGNWTGEFSSYDIQNQDDNKLNLKVFVYNSDGTLLSWRTHGDEWYLNGTAASVTSSICNITNNALSNYTVENLGYICPLGKINWTASRLDLSSRAINMDTANSIGQGYVSVNSASYSELNISRKVPSAKITMNNVACPVSKIWYKEGHYISANDIIKAEKDCEAAGICANKQCNGNILTFDVSSFTGYAIGTNSNRTIYDSAEGTTQDCYTQVCMYANYTNSIGMISGASCNLTFADEPAVIYKMAWNGINYENCSKTFMFSGLHAYSATCDHVDYNLLSAIDNISILGPVCDGGGPGGAIPEFSTIGMILTLVIAGTGILFIITRKH